MMMNKRKEQENLIGLFNFLGSYMVDLHLMDGGSVWRRMILLLAPDPSHNL
jgi:hypothetical protein